MFYLIDKPTGMTSFDVLRKLRKLLDTKKMGHTGTLDPDASGCLLVATDKSTKLIPYIEGGKKTYRTTIRIDGISETLDTGSAVEYLDTDSLTNLLIEEKIKLGQDGLKNFLLGLKKQIPPKYSALHVDGQRAYDLARKGEIFELRERSVEITQVDIITFKPPLFEIEITVSSGTYIRSLAPVIGNYFGTGIGYVEKLERIAIYSQYGTKLPRIFTQTLDDFDKNKHIPTESLLPEIETILISDIEYKDILNGKILKKEHTNDGQLYFLSYKSEIVSICRAENDSLTIIRNNL